MVRRNQGFARIYDIFEVKTEKLMQMLNENGVENVILLDLSCSPFNSKINERESRALVRDMLKKGLHGGRDWLMQKIENLFCINIKV